MTTNNSFSLVELDFTENKESLKAFLQAQPQFRDYDFEGANINVLLDVLSYNTYKMGFYYNMLISEAFLDSAQLRNSVVSHAKELNYLPRSKKSSKAQVTVNFTATGESSPYIIPRGSPFTALVKNQSFTFTTPETITVTSSNGSYSFTTYIYEGIYLQDLYIVKETIEFPKYKIANKNVDMSSVIVTVYEDGNENGDNYRMVDSLLDLNRDSKVFFMQAVDDGYYEVLFGDDFFGKKPKLGSTVSLEYRIANGSVANGCRQFSVDFDPTDSDELLDTPTITVLQNSADGLEEQDTESVRVYAPRYFATQQRAVSSDDYSSLILSKYAGTIDDVIVYGGETVEPKKYGRVIIAIKPTSGIIAADFIKDEIKSYLLKYVSLPTRIELTNPEYFYIQVNSTIQYNTSATNKTANEIRGTVTTAIQEFSTSFLQKFDADFRYSKFVNYIDISDSSITSNDTSVKIIKRIAPKPNNYESVVISYNNQLHPGRLGYDGHPIITSSSFYYITDDGVEYPYCRIRDNGAGTLVVFTTINNETVILNSNLGAADYTNGILTINRLLVSEYGDYISIYAIPIKRDVIMKQNNILFIDSSDVDISVVGVIS
jgi:hypothetical protein